jgi:hypothetical protein
MLLGRFRRTASIGISKTCWGTLSSAWANICHGKANSRGWQTESPIVTTVPHSLIKMLLGYGSPDGGFLCRSWLVLGPLLPS